MKKRLQKHLPLGTSRLILRTGLILIWLFACYSLPAQVRKAQVNGISLAYERLGSSDGEPLLLIAGTGMQLIAWSNEFCRLFTDKGFQVIRFDNRDVGLSTKLEEAGEPKWPDIIDALIHRRPAPLAYTVDDMAKDAIGLLNALHIKKAHIIGISGGSIIAQAIAAQYPRHTWSLTTMMATTGNPALPQIKPEVQALLTTILPPPAHDTPAIIARQVKILRIVGSKSHPTGEDTLIQYASQATKRCYYPIGEARQGAAALAAGDRRNELKRITVPVLVLNGQEDPIVPAEAGKDVAANIPHAELRIIPGMGHDIPQLLLTEVANAILAHLSKVQLKN